MAHDGGRRKPDARDDRKSESRDMPRLSGDGVDRCIDEDGVVHDMDYVYDSYAFACRSPAYGLTFFTYNHARELETGAPVNCFLCLAKT